MKRRTLNRVQMVKELSRERVGPVPPTKVVPQKNKKKAQKHPKKTLEELRENEFND